MLPCGSLSILVRSAPRGFPLVHDEGSSSFGAHMMGQVALTRSNLSPQVGRNGNPRLYSAPSFAGTSLHVPSCSRPSSHADLNFSAGHHMILPELSHVNSPSATSIHHHPPPPFNTHSTRTSQPQPLGTVGTRPNIHHRPSSTQQSWEALSRTPWRMAATPCRSS